MSLNIACSKPKHPKARVVFGNGKHRLKWPPGASAVAQPLLVDLFAGNIHHSPITLPATNVQNENVILFEP